MPELSMLRNDIGPSVARLGDWLRRGRQLAAQVGKPDALDTPSRLFAAMDRPGVRVVVVGGANSGVEQLIDTYLGAEILPRYTLGPVRELIIEGIDGGVETIGLAGQPGIPIADAAEMCLSKEEPWAPIVLRLSRPLLSRFRMTLIKAQPLDLLVDEVPTLVAKLLAPGDVVVLVIDAATPLRRVELEFFSECRRRELPTVVVVAKTDRITEAERNELHEYLASRLGEEGSTNPVYFPDAEGGVGEFSATVEDVLDELVPVPTRVRQTALELVSAIGELQVAADAAAERLQLADSVRAEAARTRRLGFAPISPGKKSSSRWNVVAKK